MCASAQTPTSRKFNAESREVYRRNMVLLCIITRRTKNYSRDASSSRRQQRVRSLFWVPSCLQMHLLLLMLQVRILWAVTDVTPIVLVLAKVDAPHVVRTSALVVALHVRMDVLLAAQVAAQDAVTSKQTCLMDGTSHGICSFVPSMTSFEAYGRERRKAFYVHCN